MIDQADQEIARQLAEHHMYPYAKDIYQAIFKSFSHFPISKKDIDLRIAGETITVMAWAALLSFQTDHTDFEDLHRRINAAIKEKIPPYFPQDPMIDILFGCLLYQYHPSQVRNALSILNIHEILDSQQRYEFELKKRTLYIHIL
jgi:hypothetical protein